MHYQSLFVCLSIGHIDSRGLFMPSTIRTKEEWVLQPCALVYPEFVLFIHIHKM